MTTVNLTALAETRAKMTPGEYEVAGPYPTVSIVVDHDPSNEPPIVVVDRMATDATALRSCSDQPDAAGIVAEHNAIPMLIEVARSALRLRAAGLVTLSALRAARTEGNATALAAAAAEERMALDSYNAALAKVSL